MVTRAVWITASASRRPHHRYYLRLPQPTAVAHRTAVATGYQTRPPTSPSLRGSIASLPQSLFAAIILPPPSLMAADAPPLLSLRNRNRLPQSWHRRRHQPPSLPYRRRLRLHHRSLNRRVATRHLFPDPVALPPPFCPAAVAQLSSSYPSAICGSPSRCRNNHLMQACKFFLCINRACWRLSCSLLRPALCVVLPRQLGVQRFALGVSPGPVYVLCDPCQGSRSASAEAMLFVARSALGIPVLCKLIVQRARSADPRLASGRPDVPLTAVPT